MIKQIEERHSCKKYSDQMPEIEKIEEIVKAGLLAPSGKNTQNGVIVVIKNKEIRNKLAKLNAKIAGFKDDFDPFYNAPVVLLVLVKKCPTAIYDGSCMMENILLEAQNQGLGACWIHRAHEEILSDEGKEILKDLKLDLEEYEGIAHATIGFKAQETSAKEIKENRVLYLN